MASDATVFNSNGRLFHIRGVETENVLSPYLLVDGGTCRSLLLAKCNARAGRYASSMSVMHEGVMPRWARNDRSSILYSICCFTWSQ